MPFEVFLSLSSWSVETGSLAFDDARQSRDGVWFFRDIITGEIRRFANQKNIATVYKNPAQESSIKFGELSGNSFEIRRI